MRLLIASLVFVFGLPATSANAAEGPGYATEVRPILAKHCFACHGADEGAREAELRLDVPPDHSNTDSKAARVIVPGKPGSSELIHRIISPDPELVMPPQDSGHALTKTEVEILRRWVEAGAEYETHWSFVPPSKPNVPKSADDNWSQSDLDRFVLRQLRERKLAPSPRADPYTLIRRVHLDLIGLPPSPEAADTFAANPTPEAFAAIVDELLASPRFGEHWAAMWLDLARYADTKGYEKDLPRNIWRYRDWVIEALNSDMPFDQFTVEQIAGDLLEQPSTNQLLATAFHRNTMTNDEGGTDNEEFRVAAVKDRVDTTIQVWMGLTMGCAKCHSHKYDPISQHDYYRFLAFFNQTEDADRNDDSPRVPTPTVGQLRQKDELSQKMAKLREQQKSVPPEGNADELQLLIETIEKQLAKLNKSITDTPVMRELAADKRRETFVHVRGNFLEKGDKVAPGFPDAFAASHDDSAAGRLAVAKWLVSDQNPLTARVTVNRIWSRFFGRGIVETEEDFGTQGMLPTHPELLDWLAVEFRDAHHWSLKQLCRAIVLSSTYQQTAAVSDASRTNDPQNQWFSRGPRFRLSAEAVRDQALAAAGLLSDKIGGPSVMPPQPDGIWRTTYSTLRWETPSGEDRYRRGLYTFLRRTSPYPSMLTFDGTSREVCQIRRIRTNTPLQALVTMNDPVYVEAAGALAKSVSSLHGEDQLPNMFRRVLIRPATSNELARLKQLFDDTQAEFNADPAATIDLLNEARVEDTKMPKAEELAALTVVASVILNLDEALMRP